MGEEMVFFKDSTDPLDCAFFAINPANYISYSGIDFLQNNNIVDDSIILESPILNPEQTLIQNDIISKLSNDAKFILNILFNPPDQLRCPKSKNITKRSLKIFLTKQKWNPLKINKVFIEMKNYVKNL
jgi:hypothetical protein